MWVMDIVYIGLCFFAKLFFFLVTVSPGSVSMHVLFLQDLRTCKRQFGDNEKEKNPTHIILRFKKEI